MPNDGRRHLAQDLVRAPRLPVLYPVHLLPHDGEEGFDKVGRLQTLAEFATDTQTVDSFLHWIAQSGFSPDGGHSANPNDYWDRL